MEIESFSLLQYQTLHNWFDTLLRHVFPYLFLILPYFCFLIEEVL